MDTDTSENVVGSVVSAVAAREGVDPLELPPLHEVVDPDAMNALFDRADASGVRLSLRYEGYEIEIWDGRVDLTPLATRA
jgi:hypothetical protein